MKRWNAFWILALAAPVFFSGWLWPGHGVCGQSRVYVIQASGPVSPGLAYFIETGLKKALDHEASCVVIELDTPGGLADSMRRIVMAILASPVPVAVYVSPGGARAASAGVLIAMAADIAVMAPGTHIGAAHPVGAGGKTIDGVMGDKVTNDMAAYARSVAEKKGRNAQWAEEAVRQSASITETEALKLNAVDFIASDMDDLILRLNGFQTKDKGVLRLDDVKITRVKETVKTKILKIISDPNIAYILMMIGLAGLYFEMAHPGAMVPGVLGAICLILSFFAFQTLPANQAGFLLIALALIFFIMEIKITSYGLLSVAGVVSLFLGSIMLFNGQGTGAMAVSWSVLIPVSTVISAFFIVLAGLAFKSQTQKPLTGESGLVGEIGVVKRALSPEGKALVHGEIWNARSDGFCQEGTQIRVKSVNRLVLEVEALD